MQHREEGGYDALVTVDGERMRPRKALMVPLAGVLGADIEGGGGACVSVRGAGRD